MKPGDRDERDPAVVALGHVGIFILSILVGGIAGRVFVGCLADLRAADWSVQRLRAAAVEGMMVGMGLSLPLALVLEAMGAKQVGPKTWFGWAVSGFVLGVLPAGAMAWFRNAGP